MKRIVTALLSVSMIAALSVSAFAANEEKLAERAAMKEQKQIVRQNREEMRDITQQNKALSQACKELKVQQKAEGGLDKEQKAQITEIKALITEQREVLTASKGETKELTLSAKALQKADDFAAATEVWEQAATLTGERLQAKQELLQLLGEKEAALTDTKS